MDDAQGRQRRRGEGSAFEVRPGQWRATVRIGNGRKAPRTASSAAEAERLRREMIVLRDHHMLREQQAPPPAPEPVQPVSMPTVAETATT